MKKRTDQPPRHGPDEDLEGFEEFDPYEIPGELDEPEPAPRKGRPARVAPAATGEVELDFGFGGTSAAPPRRRFPRAALAVVAVIAVAGGLIGYRMIARQKALRAAMAQAELDLRQDTADGYRKAADVLGPFAEQAPLDAGSMRAFALAMLALDYRDEAASDEVERLLIEPERAEPIPRWANLARAAVSLSRGEAGTAMTAASRVVNDPMGGWMEGRIAFAAGNLEAALEPLHTAAAAEPPLPAALALHGDAVRRAKRDHRAAQAAYVRALGASPDHVHPRAAFGLAKLALTGHVPPAEALAHLQRLLADEGTPSQERARAALHAAALALRAGDEAGAKAVLDGAALDEAGRDWAGRAAAVEADGRRVYRAVQGAPPSLSSPSDDDPPELPPIVISRAEPPPPPAVKPAKAAKAPAKATRATTKASKKKAPARKSGTRKKRTR